MAASDILKASIARFKLNPAQQQAVFNFFDQKVADPTTFLDENTIAYYVSQDPAIQTIFDERFAGNKILREQGKPEYSFSNYITLEQELQNDIRDAGFPPGFYDDPQSLAKFIGGEVSRSELKARATAAYTAVKQADVGTIQELRNLYGVTEGELAAYFLDPAKAVDSIGKRLTGQDLTRQLQAAQISAQARQQANMGLTAQQAEALANQGVTRETAQAGFATLGDTRELFQAQMAGEQAISQEEQIAGTFNTNAAARQAIAKRKRSRTAAFEAGGSFAGSQGTQTGLTTVQ